MKSIEIDNAQGVICPFCNKIIDDGMVEVFEDFDFCEHTIFMASDEGFEYIRADLKGLINNKNHDVDKYTANLPIDGIRLVDYMSRTDLKPEYWGFLR